MANILITGATGTIGVELSKHLIKNHDLFLVGRDFSDMLQDVYNQSTILQKDLIDPESWDGLLEGIDYVIQLAGESDQEAEFYGDLLEMNYMLPHNLYEEASKTEGLKRIILASSIHIVDAYPKGTEVKTTDPIRPANLYGVSKAYIEALATYHAYNNNLETIAIRIADYKASDEEISEETDEYGAAMYLSKEDFNQLIDRCIDVELIEPFLVVNGISNNTFTRLSNEEAQAHLGYQPKDNSFEKIGFFKENKKKR